MNKYNIYIKIKEMFKDVTPLKADCGLLCNCACCKGETNQGMLLFPEEKTSLKTIIVDNKEMVICNGKCNRDERPISCMIFPYFPVFNEKGKIVAELDYRGYNICPMIENADVIKFNRKFIKNIEKAGKLLYTDKDIKIFMEDISKDISDNKNDILKFR